MDSEKKKNNYPYPTLMKTKTSQVHIILHTSLFL